ncbi:protein kinase [Nocardia sp. NPDC050717]|uniref:protein kinase domain-containing protein n=1 Tax=Nocardia sp. NPDC050717 TaxID=3157221 RepID=UPI0033DC8A08
MSARERPFVRRTLTRGHTSTNVSSNNIARWWREDPARGSAHRAAPPDTLAGNPWDSEQPMVDNDPCQTQRDGGVDVIAELRAAGFADAEEIGRGGFGEVYRCTQLGIGRTVAVKVITRELDENRDRFVREQQAMGRLTGHPNIVDMLEVGITDHGYPYLVMPFHARGSLRTRLRHDGPLPLPEALHLGVKLAGALATAHRGGILHRDIKPGNILLTDYGEPALTDFGIAHITGGFQTTSGVITGSPAFTAPEVLSGDMPSEAADVYGLGSTLFCALTGHAVFERHTGEQVVAQFLRIAGEPTPPLGDSGLPADVAALLESAMAHDPADRPTALMLAEQLRDLQRRNGFPLDRIPVPDGVDTAASPPVAHRDGNLPAEVTSFVGRSLESAAVERLLDRSRLVTLTGIGGVGKSRLALRVAHTLKDDFADGVWLVELGDTRDPSLLVDALAGALGLRTRGAGPTVDVVTGYLSARHALLELDNCEQVIDGVTTLTESLLRACPHLRILATSREALDVGGESVYPVPPLPLPDPSAPGADESAVTLFAERAAAVVPDFAITDDNRPCVHRICALLDGLPLAIELAAARLKTLSPEQILARLDDRYSLLTRGRRGAPPRQRTLRWCIDWSYDLCTQDEQRLWRQLSVFTGGFELDAADRLCAGERGPAEVLDAVSALVDKSILLREQSDGTVRFRMLETVREYGRQQADAAGEYPEWARRHRDWCLELAVRAEAEWIGPHQLRWVARLERELPNLRAALEFALTAPDDTAVRISAALYPFWMMRGRPGEGRRWAARALARTTGTHPRDEARALFAAVAMAALQHDSDDAALTRLRQLAANSDDPMIGALFAHAEADIALMTGHADPVRAERLATEAIAGYAAVGELGQRLDALIALGWANAVLGATTRAIDCFEEVLTVTGSAGETMLHCWASAGAGYLAWRAGESTRAVELLAAGIRSARRVPDPLVIASCVETLAWVSADQGGYRRAAVLMGAADALVAVIDSSPFVFPSLRHHRDDCDHACRAALGGADFDTARHDGATMSLAAAADFALGADEQGRPVIR